MSILVKIGCIFFILSSKNHGNCSDLSSRPVPLQEMYCYDTRVIVTKYFFIKLVHLHCIFDGQSDPYKLLQ